MFLHKQTVPSGLWTIFLIHHNSLRLPLTLLRKSSNFCFFITLGRSQTEQTNSNSWKSKMCFFSQKKKNSVALVWLLRMFSEGVRLWCQCIWIYKAVNIYLRILQVNAAKQKLSFQLWLCISTCRHTMVQLHWWPTEKVPAIQSWCGSNVTSALGNVHKAKVWSMLSSYRYFLCFFSSLPLSRPIDNSAPQEQWFTTSLNHCYINSY